MNDTESLCFERGFNYEVQFQSSCSFMKNVSCHIQSYYATVNFRLILAPQFRLVALWRHWSMEESISSYGLGQLAVPEKTATKKPSLRRPFGKSSVPQRLSPTPTLRRGIHHEQKQPFDHSPGLELLLMPCYRGCRVSMDTRTVCHCSAIHQG